MFEFILFEKHCIVAIYTRGITSCFKVLMSRFNSICLGLEVVDDLPSTRRNLLIRVGILAHQLR
jgi:hypothetical protein